MAIRIVTDSTCDLPKHILNQFGISVVPIYVNIGKSSFLDGVELTRQQFYEGLDRFEHHPTTSAPGMGSFLKVYKQLAEEGASEIFSIHIASSLSNTGNVAALAAEAYKDVPVTVIDAGQLTIGTGLLVLAAAQAIAAQMARDDILALLKDQISRTYAFASLDTLKFLRRSGRLSHLQYGLGMLLDIKPILMMYNGEAKIEMARTRKKSIDRIINLVAELGPLEKLALVHTHHIERARELLHQAGKLFPKDNEPYLEEVTPVIGSHVGPGAVCFVAIARDKRGWPESVR